MSNPTADRNVTTDKAIETADRIDAAFDRIEAKLDDLLEMMTARFDGLAVKPRTRIDTWAAALGIDL